jgi:multidrug efflux pump subunit AcrA (membrane-fusion protein)
LAEGEAMLTGELIACNDQVTVAEHAVASALAAGDVQALRGARAALESARTQASGIQAMLADLRAEAELARVERHRIDQAAEYDALVARIDDAEDDLDATVIQFRADVLTARSGLTTIQQKENELNRMRLELSSLKAAASGSTWVDRNPVGRPHEPLNISQQLHTALMRG